MAKVKAYVLTTRWEDRMLDEADLLTMAAAREELGYSLSGVLRLQPTPGEIALVIRSDEFEKRRPTKYTLRKSVAEFRERGLKRRGPSLQSRAKSSNPPNSATKFELAPA